MRAGFAGLEAEVGQQVDELRVDSLLVLVHQGRQLPLELLVAGLAREEEALQGLDDIGVRSQGPLEATDGVAPGWRKEVLQLTHGSPLSE